MSTRRPNSPNRFLLLLSIAMLLLPVYGSWIDIHYAQRQPDHDHIYFGKVDLDHHLHPNAKGVVNLPDQNATIQPMALLVKPDEQITAHATDSDDLFDRLIDDCLFPEDTFLPPPDHPPRI